MTPIQAKLLSGLPDKNKSGTVEQLLFPYGVGIDTHSKFIAVCILIRDGNEVRRSEQQFTTDPSGLRDALQWIRKHLPKGAS